MNAWVKKGVLLGFRMGAMVDMSIDAARQPFFDKATLPVKQFSTRDSGVRIVPGGSSIRDGCFIGRGVTCMPPMYINVGSWVGDGTMVDSHALIGSCAQIGKNCHISAAAQIGGVLEPVGALPVIIEDDVLVGGNCGVYEGTVVKRRAVLGSGTILTRSTPVYDIVRGEVYSATDDEPLVIPEDAVVVAGSRAITQGPGKEWGDFAVHAGDREVSRQQDGREDSAGGFIEMIPSVRSLTVAVPSAESGARLLSVPLWNKGTAFTLEERARFGLHGLLPPYVETLEEQVERAYKSYLVYEKEMNRHIYLRQLQDNNEVLFYRLLLDHIEEMTPIVYTPVVARGVPQFQPYLPAAARTFYFLSDARFDSRAAAEPAERGD